MRNFTIITIMLLTLLLLGIWSAYVIERSVSRRPPKITRAASTSAQAGDKAPFSAEEWATIKMLSPLPALPADKTNKYLDSPAAARLGQQLFFEPRLSGAIQAG